MKDFPGQNSKDRNFRETLTRFIILILFSAAILLLINQSPWQDSAILRYDGNREYREESWVLKEGDRVLEPSLQVPAFRHLETGKQYSISTELTYNGGIDSIPSCFFFVDHMYCEAYLDGRLMFRYGEEDAGKSDASSSPGNVYVAFRMPRNCWGKELEIFFTPTLNSSVEYQLPNPFFGDYFSVAVAMFQHDLPHNVVAVLFAFLGVVSVLFSTLVLPKSKYKEGLFIGIFSILVSCYSLTESDFAFYIISNPYYTYVLDYTTFTLIPIFLMAFLRERLDARQKPLGLAMILVGAGMFVIEMVLHFTGILDMREFLPVIHVVYFTSFVIFFVMLLRMKQNRYKNQLILQMIPILLGLMLDAAVYYLHWQLGTSDSGFTSIGVFIFLIAEIYHVWNYSIEVYTLSEQSRDYMQMAYIDALTGIGNRRAMEDELKVITAGKREYRSLLVASADLNNLKITNDTLGHAAGDFLIRSAAEVLEDLCEHRCHAFRMGGDEFSVLIYDIEEPEFKKCIEKMEKAIADINRKSNAKLSLALGYEVIHNLNVYDAVQKADQKMYENKAKYKEKMAIEPAMD